MSENILELVRELTARLTAMADEFGVRADAVGSDADTAAVEDEDLLLTRRARQLLADRQNRRKFLPAELFHEPAWDMLVGLFIARTDQRPMNVKALASYADAPVTTSQRWIEHLYKTGLITRTIDLGDRRRIEVALTEMGLQAMTRYLRSLPSPLPRIADRVATPHHG